MMDEYLSRRTDHPLCVGEALSSDTIHRVAFARSVLKTLELVDSKNGLVISIEGMWGSGKTSVLAMVEELAQGAGGERPVIVHFNPWLIGDRDALLRQFLASISKEVELADHAKDGKRVAKELKTYSKAFDVLKLIPGAEPWATMIKGVLEAVGGTVGDVAEHKAPDIEERKNALDGALRNYSRRIIVLIDDIDRLFPAEVFEMVRIVKAVGNFPNIGYVLAWDPIYVSTSLRELKVPFAESYLDKIVQLRLPIPPLSFSMRVKLMDEAHSLLSAEARASYFPNSDDRLSELFHSGLASLIETPRDVVRLYELVRALEVGLRGELHIAEILGLSCLMMKAPTVYQLLQRIPQAFVGSMPGLASQFESPQEIVNLYEKEIASAIQNTSNAKAIRTLVSFLFPLVANIGQTIRLGITRSIEGRLSNPERLHVALQLSLHPDDLSFLTVRKFINLPDRRAQIADSLRVENCSDFLNSLAQLVTEAKDEVIPDSKVLAIAIAGLVEKPVFVERERTRTSVMQMRHSRTAVGVIDKIAGMQDPGAIGEITLELICHPKNLSVAAELVLFNFADQGSKPAWILKVAGVHREYGLTSYSNNVISALKDGSLYGMVGSGLILWALAWLAPNRCREAFDAAISYDATGDFFIEAYLRFGFDSIKGQIYGLPEDIAHLVVFAELADLKQRAAERLDDITLSKPTRAAWMAVLHGNRYYSVDCSMVER